MNFKDFRNAQQKHFTEMSNQLFTVTVNKDELWEYYLNSFPAGTNPIFRERTVHDCNCCKQFIRAAGNIISIVDGKKDSIWNIPGLKTPYKEVAEAMHKKLMAAPVDNLFYTEYNVAGTLQSKEMDEKNNLITWDHFQLRFNARYFTNDIGESRSIAKSSFDVLYRMLNEVSIDALHIVKELIDDDNLARGAEKQFFITTASRLKAEFDKLDHGKKLFVWEYVHICSESFCKMYNSSIGMLLKDLTAGKPLANAVSAYEKIVAPENYQRPKPIVTKSMLRHAQKEVEKLGLMESIYRRPAVDTDLHIKNLFWVSPTTRAILMENPFDEIIETLPDAKVDTDRISKMPIQHFLSDVLPNTKTISLFLENKHINNLVSIIAPEHATAPNLFKWDNPFSWTYNNNVADSIKDRVKAAGGNTDAFFRASLAWNNHDDLDLHMDEPHYHIYYHAKISTFTSGYLDVDANRCADVLTSTPVENIAYSDRMPTGNYTLKVHNYAKRSSVKPGFTIEIAFGDNVLHLYYKKPVQSDEVITVAEIRVDGSGRISVLPKISTQEDPKEVWGLWTQKFHPVNVITKSPNFWHPSEIGNLHYFFILENCRFDKPLRGFFNEYLTPELRKHRKVFELLGDKMSVAPTNNQLSGVGFSHVLKKNVILKVSGTHTRLINVTF